MGTVNIHRIDAAVYFLPQSAFSNARDLYTWVFQRNLGYDPIKA